MARHGNLTLTGTVSYGSQRAAAETAVAALTGVRGIKNKIEVEYDTEPTSRSSSSVRCPPPR
jgi:hypothetical protein